MSQIEKLLIPLIDNNITADEILSSKFIGIFTEDINLPGLDYIYLVYSYDMNDLHSKISTNGIDYVRRIGDNLYHIIKFPRCSLDLKKILNGNYNLLSNEGISKIYNFWKDFDSDTANYPFSKVISAEKYYRCIPEEKFIPLSQRKPEGLTVKK